MITIQADNGWFRATLDDTSEGGVVVAVWARIGRSMTDDDMGMWKLLRKETLDVPMHVACDLVHEMVNKLRREV